MSRDYQDGRTAGSSEAKMRALNYVERINKIYAIATLVVEKIEKGVGTEEYATGYIDGLIAVLHSFVYE